MFENAVSGLKNCSDVCNHCTNSDRAANTNADPAGLAPTVLA